MTTLPEQALTLQKQGQLDQAEQLYQDFLRENSDNASAWHGFAILAVQQNALPLALERVNQAIKLDGSQALYFQSQGNILRKLGQIEAATLALENALALEKDNPEILNQLGALYYHRQDFAEALQYYARVLQLKPDSVQTHFNLGLLFMKTGEIDAAIKQFRNVITLHENFPLAHKYLADLYLQRDALPQARKHYEILLREQADDLDALNNLGVTYLKLKQPETAIHYFTQALLMDENHLDARNNLAAVYLHEDRYDNARTHYERFIQLKPEDVEANYNLGVCYMALGELRKARDHFNRVPRHETLYLDAAVNLAAVYLKLGQRDQALRRYQAILRIDAKHPVANYMWNALCQQELPAKAPEQYIQNLFDNYAGYYDKHIREVLRYQLPGLMRDTLQRVPERPPLPWRILDLGCGTGLAGALFRDLAGYLAGIDISAKMIRYAKNKNIYDFLLQGDIADSLGQLRDTFDLIIAADVFVYMGDLSGVFQGCRNILTTQGLFIFSVESLTDSVTADYQLQTTARFAHRRSYIEKLARNHQYRILLAEEVTLRYQDDKPVAGFLVVVQAD